MYTRVKELSCFKLILKGAMADAEKLHVVQNFYAGALAREENDDIQSVVLALMVIEAPTPDTQNRTLNKQLIGIY